MRVLDALEHVCLLESNRRTVHSTYTRRVHNNVSNTYEPYLSACRISVNGFAFPRV